MHLLSLWFYENTLFYFCPIYEWTNTLKLVGEKANTKSNQAEKEL